MRRYRFLAAALLVFATVACSPPETSPTQDEQKLIESMGLGGYTVTYQGDDGKTLSAGEFIALVRDSKRSFSINKNVSKHTARVALTPAGEKRTDLSVGMAIEPGQSMPAIVRTDLDGVARSLNGSGKPLLISFFFAECMPCVHEVPELNAIAKAHPELDVVAVTFDAAPVAKKFVATHKLEWPVIADAMDYLEKVGAKAFPTLAFVGADGKLVASRSGGAMPGDNSAAEPNLLEGWVRETLQKAVTSSSP